MDLFGIHIIGYAAALIGTLSYLIRAPRRILVLHAASWAVWGIYYGAMGGMSGVIVAALGVVSCSAGAVAGQAWLARIMKLSLIAIWCIGIGLASDPFWNVAILAPLIASTIEVVSLALRDRPIAFRISAMASNLCWIAFGLSIDASASIIFGFVNLGVMIATITLILVQSRSYSVCACPDDAMVDIVRCCDTFEKEKRCRTPQP
jgi:hypothetical protein